MLARSQPGACTHWDPSCAHTRGIGLPPPWAVPGRVGTAAHAQGAQHALYTPMRHPSARCPACIPKPSVTRRHPPARAPFWQHLHVPGCARVSAHISVCLHTYLCIHTRTCNHVRAYVHSHAHMCTQVCTHMCIQCPPPHACRRTHLCLRTCAHRNACARARVRRDTRVSAPTCRDAQVHARVCVCTCLCAHTHTHTRLCTHRCSNTCGHTCTQVWMCSSVRVHSVYGSVHGRPARSARGRQRLFKGAAAAGGCAQPLAHPRTSLGSPPPRRRAHRPTAPSLPQSDGVRGDTHTFLQMGGGWVEDDPLPRGKLGQGRAECPGLRATLFPLMKSRVPPAPGPGGPPCTLLQDDELQEGEGMRDLPAGHHAPGQHLPR